MIEECLGLFCLAILHRNSDSLPQEVVDSGVLEMVIVNEALLRILRVGRRIDLIVWHIEIQDEE